MRKTPFISKMAHNKLNTPINPDNIAGVKEEETPLGLRKPKLPSNFKDFYDHA